MSTNNLLVTKKIYLKIIQKLRLLHYVSHLHFIYLNHLRNFSMRAITISLKKSLDVRMEGTFQRLNEISGKDNQALRQEYKEWLKACELDEQLPYVLYMVI